MHIIGTYHGILNQTGTDSLPAMLCSKNIEESVVRNSSFAHMCVDFDRLGDDDYISAFQISLSSVRSFIECRDYEMLKERGFSTSLESCASEKAALSFIRKNRNQIVDLDDEDNQYDPLMSLSERINTLKQTRASGKTEQETKLKKMALVNMSLMVETLNKIDQLEYVSKQADAYL